MTPPPTSIDGTDITGATIDGQEVQEITVDGQTVFTSVLDAVTNRWLYDEGSGNILNDSVGSTNLSLDAPVWETGSGTGDVYLQFDGADVAETSDTSEVGADTFAAYGWVFPDSLSGLGVIQTTLQGPGNGVWLLFSDGSILKFGIFGTGDVDISSDVLQTNTWNFVGVSADLNNSAELYHAFAGDSSVTQIASTSYNTASDRTKNVYHHGETIDANGWQGRIDQQYFVNGSPLSQAQFEDEFQRTKGSYI